MRNGGSHVDSIAILMASSLVVPVAALAVGALRVRRLAWGYAVPWWVGAVVFAVVSPVECGAADTQPPIGFCAGLAGGVGFTVDGGTDPLAQSLGWDVTLLAALRLSALAVGLFVAVILLGNLLASHRSHGSVADHRAEHAG